MPNNMRGEIKRKLEQSQGNLDNAIEKLSFVLETNAKHHPEISGAMHICIMSIHEIKALINRVNKEV